MDQERSLRSDSMDQERSLRSDSMDQERSLRSDLERGAACRFRAWVRAKETVARNRAVIVQR
ncbi:hypothetical protein ABIB34_002242 [Rhodococcus sp. UYP5]